MDLRHLRTFVAVAELGTVSRAAEQLRTAQPALSRQIRTLEDDLRVRLFDRIGRRLLLTGEGEQLLGYCRSVLGAVTSLNEQAELARRPDAGTLKVGATPQTIDGILSPFLIRYAERRPNIRIRLTEAVGASGPMLLESGDLHLLISTAGALEGGNHPLEKLWLPPLEFIAAYRPDFSLAGENTLDIRDLGSHPLLLLDRTFAVRVAFDAACRVAELKPNVSFESRAPHTLLALAEAGRGIAIVPSVMPTQRYDIRTNRLVYRQKALREGYAIAWDKRRLLPPTAAEFCRSLLLYVRDTLPSRTTRPRKKLPQREAKRSRSC